MVMIQQGSIAVMMTTEYIEETIAVERGEDIVIAEGENVGDGCRVVWFTLVCTVEEVVTEEGEGMTNKELLVTTDEEEVIIVVDGDMLMVVCDVFMYREVEVSLVYQLLLGTKLVRRMVEIVCVAVWLME